MTTPDAEQGTLALPVHDPHRERMAERVRAQLRSVVEAAQSSPARCPWPLGALLYWRRTFPAMAGDLPECEARDLVQAFTAATEGYDPVALV